MPELNKAQQPFTFFTRLHLSELTGLKAHTLEELIGLIKTVSGSCIYHHTHRILQQHLYLSPEPPNDFAYWVSEILGEDELGERLASIDIIQFSDIRSLRDTIINIIELYMKENPSSRLKFSSPEKEFYFIKSVSFILATKHVANDLSEFVEELKKVTIDSVYFHIFEAKLRLGKTTNDFSNWIETSIGDKYLADMISRIDPYTHSLEDLRKLIIGFVSKRIEGL
ncbi:MAG TPA: DUF5752 family protein [Candidatus Omnitrophota bacterium]|nr:DUF5752 family protein [Candidatus Omnitrophota bacterium]